MLPIVINFLLRPGGSGRSPARVIPSRHFRGLLFLFLSLPSLHKSRRKTTHRKAKTAIFSQ
nr:MAG TPA: hypothetical protein [Caudoviricetes sp.]